MDGWLPGRLSTPPFALLLVVNEMQGILGVVVLKITTVTALRTTSAPKMPCTSLVSRLPR